MRIPTWIELGLAGIDVETVTQRTADRLAVRQSVTNRTQETVSYCGHLAIADREPVQRMIANLQSGQTITREYEVDKVSELAGHRMRLGLREVSDPRVWNCVLDVP